MYRSKHFQNERQSLLGGLHLILHHSSGGIEKECSYRLKEFFQLFQTESIYLQNFNPQLSLLCLKGSAMHFNFQLPEQARAQPRVL